MRISDWSSDVCSSDLPAREAERALVFFPGSTLGNFTHAESLRLLRAMRATMGERGRALLGIDLRKSPAVIEAASHDPAGIDRKSVVWGKRVSLRVGPGGRRRIKKKKK